MPLLTTAIAHLLVILAIGLIVGIVFNRFGRSWFGRATSSAGLGDVTYVGWNRRSIHRLSCRCGFGALAVSTFALPYGSRRRGTDRVAVARSLTIRTNFKESGEHHG